MSSKKLKNFAAENTEHADGQWVNKWEKGIALAKSEGCYRMDGKLPIS
jgi:hypothetical protein